MKLKEPLLHDNSEHWICLILLHIINNYDFRFGAVQSLINSIDTKVNIFVLLIKQAQRPWIIISLWPK